METSLLIRGADVVVGKRVDKLDVAVDDGRISAVGPDLPVSSSGEVIDALGHLLLPGFIDLHAHSALRVFDDPLLGPKVSQGFTTELICPDGLGPAPVSDQFSQDRQLYLHGLEPSKKAPWDWRNFSEYLRSVSEARPSTNMVSCVPHSAVREVVMGPANRPPDRHEIAEMKSLVTEAFEAGCRALSFGLIYAPGLYADTEELLQLAEIAANYDAPLVPHVRNESKEIVASMREFIDVARRSGAPLHISHLKLVGFPELLSDLLDVLTREADDIRLTVDQYPYGAGSTILSALLPPYANEDGPAGLLERLCDQSERDRMARDMAKGLPRWENLFGACGADNIVITQAAGDRSIDEGKSVAQIAKERGVEPEFAVMDLLSDTGLDAAMIDHYSSEKVVREIFASSNSMVGSDGVFNPHPHPRLYGTAARVLGRYAIREKLISIPEAVDRLSVRPAALLGLGDRGVIEVGKRADLVLIDPTVFVDTATFDSPHQNPPGVDLVMVGGTPVWRNGAHTRARPGVVTREAKF
ncbi:MAG: N-acyl-D-amino-acid deacylase family protein [Mycobacteriaceae bacterium]|uniref:N-acyl-D-amino-acid deacylase family protein n=1 Tax=Corynebacterium sp. TaxID=1720 RepID=UPI003F9DD080